MIQSDSFSVAPGDKIKNSNIYAEAVEKHTERILHDFPDGFILKVVVDCGCGAASMVTPHLLRKLGCSIDTPRNLAKSVIVE